MERDICKVENFPPNSQECKYMDFGPINTNAYIGGVSLKPYLLDQGAKFSNFTVLNITFTNIKWKSKYTLSIILCLFFSLVK